MRLDLRLVAQHSELSRRKAQEVVRKGQVDVDGQRATEPGLEVADGAKVHWDPNRKSIRIIRTPLRILHEDPDLLVVSKPAGLLTVPTDDGVERETLVAYVSDYVARRDGRKGYVGVVHRLDIDTTGALVFATSKRAEEGLRELFMAHRIDRIYDALVVPAPRTDEGTIRAPISRRMIAGRRRVVTPSDPDGQPAATHWKVLQRWNAGAHVEVTLETGRQHQIRIHLSHDGNPVLGDPTYYSRERDEPVKVSRPMLHARRLGFIHPVTRKSILVEEPLPTDFRDAIRRLATAPAGRVHRRPEPTERRPPASRRPPAPRRPGPPTPRERKRR